MATNLIRCALAFSAGFALIAMGQDNPSVAHLPAPIQKDILDWRARVEAAKCLKVVFRSDQTWARMFELDEQRNPTVYDREELEAHSWMTPDLMWMVVYPVEDGVADLASPVEQIYWDREKATVWERTWLEDVDSYRVRQYTTDVEYGPVESAFPSKGCIYATVMESWLTGGPLMTDRCTTAQSITLHRNPNLAIVPPDPTKNGVWLDVFQKDHERDQRPEPEVFYRRHDFMLLSSDTSGQPVVSQWRTIVHGDMKNGGPDTVEITAIRDLEYRFFDTVPAELLEATQEFATKVEARIGE